MTYRLEPGLARIISPITLHFPDGEKMEFKNGQEAAEAVVENKYVVKEIQAVDSIIEITLKEPGQPDETFF